MNNIVKPDYLKRKIRVKEESAGSVGSVDRNQSVVIYDVPKFIADKNPNIKSKQQRVYKELAFTSREINEV